MEEQPPTIRRPNPERAAERAFRSSGAHEATYVTSTTFFGASRAMMSYLGAGPAHSQPSGSWTPAPGTARRADLAEILVAQAVNLLQGCAGPRIKQTKVEPDDLFEGRLGIHHGRAYETGPERILLLDCGLALGRALELAPEEASPARRAGAQAHGPRRARRGYLRGVASRESIRSCLRRGAARGRMRCARLPSLPRPQPRPRAQWQRGAPGR